MTIAKRRILWIGVPLAALLLVLLVLGVLSLLLPARGDWVAGPGAGAVVPPQFRMLVFPVASVQAEGAAEPARAGRLDRAVLLSWREWTSGDAIAYRRDDREVSIAKGSVTQIPPATFALELQRLNTEIATWGNKTDWSSVRFEFESSSASITCCKLTLIEHGGDFQVYWYDVAADGTVTPRRWRSSF
ncbi:MAG: hypothetical protein ACKVZJ_03115 [Phycisphaerales bacterium]